MEYMNTKIVCKYLVKGQVDYALKMNSTTLLCGLDECSRHKLASSEATTGTTLLLHLLGDLSEDLHGLHSSVSTVSEASLLLGRELSILEVLNTVSEAGVNHRELHFHLHSSLIGVIHNVFDYLYYTFNLTQIN